jgi:hypothetical protein
MQSSKNKKCFRVYVQKVAPSIIQDLEFVPIISRQSSAPYIFHLLFSLSASCSSLKLKAAGFYEKKYTF